MAGNKTISSSFTVNVMEKGDTGAQGPKGETGPQGNDGTSPYIADIDNQMDSVRCYDNGKPIASQSVTAKLQMYHGSSPVGGFTISVTRNGSSMPQTGVSYSFNSGSRVLTISYTTDATVLNAKKDDFEITLSATDGGSTITRSVHLYVNAVTGDIHNLKPNVSEISTGRTDAGGYNPSTFNLKCGYTRKDINGNITSVDDVTGQIDSKYYVYYRRRTRSTQAYENYRLYTSYKSDLAQLDLATYDSVQFVMCTGMSSNVPSGVIDIEDVPVVADGVKGQPGGRGDDGDDAVVYNLLPSPESINFRTNAAGDAFTGSETISVTITRTIGTTSASYAYNAFVHEGKKMFYRYRYSDSSWSSWSVFEGSLTISAATAQSVGYRDVEFVLASFESSNPNVPSSTYYARRTVGITFDGLRGNAGAMGKMFYSMGEWEAKTYTRTELSVPMVHYDDGEFSEATGKGNYYYLNADSASSSDVPGTSSKWVKAAGFGVVITQGLFAEFAKLGKAIMSGDYMFSMNGRIGNTEYNGGAKIGGVPAYMRFCGDPDVLSGSYGVDDRYGPTSSDPELIASLYLAKGVTLNVTVTAMRISGSGTGYFRIYKNGQLASVSFSSTSISTKTMTWTTTEDGWYYIQYYNTNSATHFYFRVSYNVTGYFEPNYWVDLLTGKLVAARGNFVVKPDGDVEVSGTIRAANLFHHVCYYYGGGACVNGGEQYQKYSEGDGYLWYDTSGLADIIEILPTSGRSWGTGWSYKNDYTILLPEPTSCEGKIVTVYCRVMIKNSPIGVGCVGTNKMVTKWSLNSSNILTPASEVGVIRDAIYLETAYSVLRYKLSDDWSGTPVEDGFTNLISEYAFISQNGYWFMLKGVLG